MHKLSRNEIIKDIGLDEKEIVFPTTNTGLEIYEKNKERDLKNFDKRVVDKKKMNIEKKF